MFTVTVSPRCMLEVESSRLVKDTKTPKFISRRMWSDVVQVQTTLFQFRGGYAFCTCLQTFLLTFITLPRLVE